ncbi:MAG: SDR family NAD(P)-dependent oxidoreductase [Chloroflexi bacterium]|nr:SDR family NAD(P)-dependent oxidoreductase [Chloroflexota bacterium]MDL1882853.1 SDR family oxidoreductase [Anaerolineae bacterium CFX8]
MLVTGASGHLGRRVIELLLESQNRTIIATTRTPEKLADFGERGVIVRPADFENPASLAKAFAGADRLLLISTDALGVPGQRLNQHRSAVKAAEQAGVSHVVYTSLINPGPDSPVLLAPDHLGTEIALAESKMGWTVLRENIYAEVLLGSLIQAVQFGGLFNAAANGKAAYITREDCARAAAAALAASFEGRRTLDITGPEALSQTELAALAGRISGKQLDYVPLELEVLIQNMVNAGLPRPLAETYASFDTAIAQGKFSAVTNSVEELTGRKPISVAEFLAANRDALAQTAAVR